MLALEREVLHLLSCDFRVDFFAMSHAFCFGVRQELKSRSLRALLPRLVSQCFEALLTNSSKLFSHWYTMTGPGGGNPSSAWPTPYPAYPEGPFEPTPAGPTPGQSSQATSNLPSLSPEWMSSQPVPSGLMPSPPTVSYIDPDDNAVVDNDSNVLLAGLVTTAGVGAVFFIIFGVVVYFVRRGRNEFEEETSTGDPEELSSGSERTVDYDILSAARLCTAAMVYTVLRSAVDAYIRRGRNEFDDETSTCEPLPNEV